VDHFFKPTEEEIKNSGKGNRPDQAEFANGDKVSMQIKEVKEQLSADGKSMMIVGTTVVSSGDNQGKEHSIFIRDNATSKGIWINIMKAFFDEAVIKEGNLKPTDFVGKTMTSTAKVREYNGKNYTDFYQFEAHSDVPALQAVGSDNIPF
jgi:hypothetical protein